MCRETGVCPAWTMAAMMMRTPDVARVSAFLGEYCASLLGCGATCVRMEKNVSRIAAAWHVEVDMSIMPRHIHLSVRDMRHDECLTSVVATSVSPISYELNTSLSRLSWEIADGDVDYTLALERMREARKETVSRIMLPLASCANAAFCRLFGGDLMAMAVVFLATLAGLWLKGRLACMKVDARVIWFVCAFVSAVLGSTGLLFPLSRTPETALATSVLYLVPGIPFLNSFSDMLYRHYICAFSRFADAVVMTCCLSGGLCAAMMLMQVGMF